MVDVNAFRQFMERMKGQDPNQLIQSMVQSGKLSQQQLNQIQMQAKQMESQFDGFKGMFGFHK